MRKLTTEEFIEKSQKIHGCDKYDYSKVDYITNKKIVIIICKKHGPFNQYPMCHLKGYDCLKCGFIKTGISFRSNTIKFIEKAKKIHGCDKYDYSKVNYTFSDKKVIIICRLNHEFEQTPETHLGGCGCPFCKNKTEGKLFLKIKSIYSSLICQYTEDWCRNKINVTNRLLPFDFCIPELNIIIELDGPQHFRQIINWRSPEEQFKMDKYKEKCANDNGYSIIRILQEDVYYDKYDWFIELQKAIDSLKIIDKPINIYLCKNGEYNNF